MIFTINCHNGEVLNHPDRDQAAYYSFINSATLIVEKPSDLNIGLLTQNIIWLYNKVTGKSLPPDTTRKEAAQSLFTAIEKHSTAAPTIERDNTMPATKSRSTRRVARQATRSNATKTVRHNSPMAGKKLIKVEKRNPRREGTEGFKSWERWNSGATYEKAIEAGARPQDIRWDI